MWETSTNANAPAQQSSVAAHPAPVRLETCWSCTISSSSACSLKTIGALFFSAQRSDGTAFSQPSASMASASFCGPSAAW